MTGDSDLDEWLDTLAGRGSASPNSTAARLRKIILEDEQRLQKEILATHPSNEEALQALQDRLQREQSRRQPRLTRRYRLPLALAATVLVAGSLLVVQFSHAPTPAANYPAPSELRGDIHRIDLRLPHPREAAEALHDELTSAGMPSMIYQEGGNYFVDFNVQGDSSSVLGKTLIGGGLLAQPGLNRITITAP